MGFGVCWCDNWFWCLLVTMVAGMQLVGKAFVNLVKLEPLIMNFYYGSFVLFYLLAGLVTWVTSHPASKWLTLPHSALHLLPMPLTLPHIGLHWLDLPLTLSHAF